MAKLRNGGFDGRITLIGAEPCPPYQRPPLSKGYLLGDMTLERLFLRPEAFYADQGIALKTDCRVTAIDPEARVLSTTEGEVAYDELVLATGSLPRRLLAAIGGDLVGVFTVRDLADVDAMAPRFSKGAKVLIVGGATLGWKPRRSRPSRGLRSRWWKWPTASCSASQRPRPVIISAPCMKATA